MVGDLVAIVPGIEEAVLRVVVYLGGVGILVLKQQPGNNLRVGVGVKSIGDVGVPLVIAVHGIQHPTDDEAVAIEIPPEPSAPGGLLLCAQVHGIELAQDNDLLAEAFVIQSGINEPQAILIHGKVHVRVALPPPGCGLLIGHVVEHGPGSYVALLQVILDDVSGEGPVVVEGTVVHHVTRADPAVRKLVGIAPATCGGKMVGSFREARPGMDQLWTGVCTRVCVLALPLSSAEWRIADRSHPASSAVTQQQQSQGSHAHLSD